MSSSKNAPTSATWQIQGKQAQLKTATFSAEVDLNNPACGLQKLCYLDSQITGHLLGVSPGRTFSKSNLIAKEAFTRSSDLLVAFAETEQQPYSLEIYWRSTNRESIMVVDLLISLETQLLESFPGVSTRSQIAADKVWLVPFDDAPATEVTASASIELGQQACSIVLQPSGVSWSYVEMHHPEDQGKVSIASAASGQATIHRELAGAFMEKGVIRRLRIRGGLVPRQDDLQSAKQLLQELATETPPLTA